MPIDLALNLPNWFAVLLLIGCGLAFGLLSWPQGEEPKTKVSIKSPLFDRYQRRHREMQRRKLSKVSEQWQTEIRRGGDAA